MLTELPASPITESTRLTALASYDILDTLPEEDYDGITQIAAYICQTPISLITLLDDKRQWFKSTYGLAVRQTPREIAFCDYAIQTPGQLMEVADAHLDERFATNPLVTGDPHVVFYAGVPLVDTDGHALGTLCVIDHQTRQLSAEQATVLKALARQVVTQLQLRRSQSHLEKAGQNLQTCNSELQESNRILKTVIDTCPVGLVLWQAVREQETIVDFRYVLGNPINSGLAGLSMEQMTGNLLKTLFPHVVPTGFFDRLVSVVETKNPQHFQQLYARDNQTYIWGNMSLVPYRDGILLSFQDITHLKETEEQLRTHTDNLNQLVAERTAEIHQLSALHQAIVYNAGMAIISTDINGLIQTVNPAAEKLLGYRADELIGKKNPTVLHDPARLESLAQELSDHLGRSVPIDFDLIRVLADNHTHEYTALTKDGRKIPILLTRTTLRDEAGKLTGYVGMATDITSQKKIELVLQQSLEREQELNKLKSQFVTTASHEFRTPLATIQSSVELIKLHLERHSADSQPAIQRHLGIIEKQVANFGSLLSDVLAVGKIEAGRVSYHPQAVDIVILASEVISTHYSERQDGRSVPLLVTGQPRPVVLDAQLITHILVNLLSNAFKFSTQNPSLHIAFDEHQLVLKITDKGIGIPAADLSQLFESFFRASNAVNVPGSGLGLVITRQFVERHGGLLDIQSEEHVGTTCTLTLPT